MSDIGVIIDLEVGWNEEIMRKAIEPLKAILDEGIKRSPFTYKEYTATYTICYNMCTQRSPFNWSEQLYERHGETIAKYLNDTVLPALRNRHDIFLLQELVRRWQNHKIMNKWMQKFFMYLDRYHVKYNSLPPLKEAGLHHFKTVVYEAVKKDVASGILAMINEERENVVVDRDLIRSCVDLFESMGMGSIDVYENDLEKYLLESSKEYYARKAELWMETDSTPIYLVKAEKALESERERVVNYLNVLSEPKLLGVIETELLEKKERMLLEKEGSGMRALLINDKDEDLTRMFRLFSRVRDGGLNPMAEIFRDHIVSLGMECVNARRARIDSLKEREKESSNDPQFIKDLLALHDKYLGMVDNQFKGHALFQKALKDAFAEAVNKDVGKHKNADLLSSFCDQLLKTGGEKLGEDEVESYLEKVVQLFSYLGDKDMYAEIYRSQLARRLLNQRSASDDMERLMISKLKLRCGSQFTGKMEGMLTDLSIGADHQQSFDSYCRDGSRLAFAGPMEFSAQVLTISYWPSYKTYDVVLPNIMAKCCQVFTEFYEVETSKRRLQWVHSLGDAIVKGIYKTRSYDFQISTLQAAALLAFSSTDGESITLSYTDLGTSMRSLYITLYFQCGAVFIYCENTWL